MPQHINIRMYNVGLGDSFLITFPADDRPRKVLIDCGVHSAGPGPRGISEVAEKIVEDVKEDGTPRIDVIVATHRHKDHVSGFDNPIWETVEVGEVWMPWTEHPTDAEARRIRELQSKKAQAFVLALRAMNAAPHLIALAENSLTNFEAMRTLHHGFHGKPKRRFLPHKSRSKHSMSLEILPDVTIHTLGPSRDPEVMRDMNPPKGESLLRFGRSAEERDAVAPVAERWSALSGRRLDGWIESLSEKNARKKNALLSRIDQDTRQFLDSITLSAADIKTVTEAAFESPLSAVVALDKAVNGTSLMLMFEMDRAFLLFAGDAQWGTWHNAMSDPMWAPLLRSTTFYKVGHHGSHNATPASFIEDFLRDEKFSAMVSTRETKVFKQIPRGPLLDALVSKAKGVARSDQTKKVAGFTRKNDVFTEIKVPV